MKKITIAVDGTSGSGKSSTFKEISKRINYEFIDTGLMYRAFTLVGIENNIDFQSETEIISLLKKFSYQIKNNKIFVNKKEVMVEKLETQEIINKINFITKVERVREFMVGLMRSLVNDGGVIMVGRDITSVVLPNADLKIYLDSSVESRAKRRFEQYLEKKIAVDFGEIKDAIEKRDFSDKNRQIGALKIVSDAWYIDNSNMSLEEIINIVIKKIKTLESEV